MPPAVLVDINLQILGRPRWIVVVWSIAGRALHAGATAIAGPIAQPGPSRMFLAKPAAIIAAVHFMRG
jgi:hypothetical protein